MDDKIRKYTFGGVRIYVVNIKKTAEDTRFANDLDEDMTNHTAIAEVIAACLCAHRKEDNASTALSLKYPEKETAYTAIAEND